MAGDVKRRIGVELTAENDAYRKGFREAADDTKALGQTVATETAGMSDDLKQVGDSASKAGDEAKRSFDGIAAGGAALGAGLTATFEGGIVSAGQLQARLGLTADEAREFDKVAKEVYRDNFGESMSEAAAVTGMVTQSLHLQGDELKTVTEGIFSISDAFVDVGADTQILVNDLRVMKAVWPGVTEERALDLIAHSFQQGTGNAGDLLDTVQEYSGAFATAGFTADDMFILLDHGMRNGARNTDILADAILEMGIKVKTTGDTGQEAVRKMFPPDEAARIISNFSAGGEAARAAFQDIGRGLAEVQDPQDQYNLAVELFGTKGEELTALIPTLTGSFGELGTSTEEAGGAVERTGAQYTGLKSTLEGLKRQVETSVLGPLGDIGPLAATGFEGLTAIGTAALGFKGLGIELGSMVGPLRSIAGVAAKGTLYAAGFAAMGNALTSITGIGKPEDLSAWAEELEILARTGQGFNFDSIVTALDDIADPSIAENVGAATSRIMDYGTSIASLGMLDITGTAARNEERIRAFDDALASLVKAGNAEMAAAAFDDLVVAAEGSGVGIDTITAAFPGYARAVELVTARTDDHADAVDGSTESVDENTGALDENRRATDELFYAITAGIDAQMGFERANINAREAIRRYADTTKDAEASADDLKSAELDAADAVFRLADAAIAAEEQERGLESGQLDAATAAQIQRDSLQQVVNILGPNDPLRARLQEYIAQLDRIPTDITTQLNTIVSNPQWQAEAASNWTGKGWGGPRRAGGGPVSAGETYWVGEEGPELYTATEDGWIHPHGESMAMAGGNAVRDLGGMGGGGSVVYRTYNISTQSFDPQASAVMVRDAIRTIENEGL